MKQFSNFLTTLARPFMTPAVLFLTFLLLFSTLPEDAAARTISPLPPQLATIQDYRGNNGTDYYFLVTGTVSGALDGTGIYTDDSSVATAAVHAGILAEGEEGVVKVTILPGQSSYTGSTANNVTSNPYLEWPGSFSVAPDDGGDNPVLPDPGYLIEFRGIEGGVYLFSVTGDNGGENIQSWGTNVYTDDSQLKTVVVHAGILAHGQTGTVRVVVGPDILLSDPWDQEYIGCIYNGVNSIAYSSAYGGSYAVMPASGFSTLIPYPGTAENPFPNSGYLTSVPSPNIRGLNGAAYHFTATGSTSGSTIWGTDIYTDDSYLYKAAVHRGVLADGETGVVKVTILPGQSNYIGSTRNGVTSFSYGSYSGSYTPDIPDGLEGDLPVITSPATASAAAGSPFTYQVTATNSPSEFAASGLPEGLSINTVSGYISGTPKLSGSFTVNLLAKNSLGVRAAPLYLSVDGLSGGTIGGGAQPWLFLLID